LSTGSRFDQRGELPGEDHEHLALDGFLLEEGDAACLFGGSGVGCDRFGEFLGACFGAGAAFPIFDDAGWEITGLP
jgi:hypothetical protein